MNRLEIKFDITNIDRRKLISELNLVKEYRDRTITSIYYDTDNFKFFYDSEEGLTPRKKVRLRYYDNLKEKKNLEIKFTQPSYRQKITYKDINESSIKKVFNEINLSEKQKPSACITYKRKYFKNKTGRFNIDYQISFKKNDLNQEACKLRLSSKKILEFKTLQIDKKFNFLSNFPLKETRSSKYCDAMQILYNL